MENGREENKTERGESVKLMGDGGFCSQEVKGVNERVDGNRENQKMKMGRTGKGSKQKKERKRGGRRRGENCIPQSHRRDIWA